VCGPAPCDGGTTTLIVKRQLLSLGIKIKWSATVDAVERNGREEKKTEKKKRQQSSLRSSFDFQLVHRWIELSF